MYVSGHEEILRLALSGAPPPDGLLDGLRYPDLPCAQRVFVGGRVKHIDYRPCGVVQLRHLVGPVGHRVREIYMSHKGPLAILHSMTPDATVLRGAVRGAIVREAVVMFRLALHDDVHAWRMPAPNAFWLGQVLHIVMDSYSPAHTLRRNTREKPGETPASRRRRALAASVRHPRSHELLLRMFDALQQRVAPAYVRSAHRRLPEQSAELEAWVRERLQAAVGGEVEEYMRTREGSELVFDLFAVAVFRLQEARRLRGLLRGPAVAANAAGRRLAIMEFRDYARQSHAFHAKYDLMTNVRRYGLLEPAVRDVRFVLQLYADALARGARGLVQGPRALKDYLERVTLALA